MKAEFFNPKALMDPRFVRRMARRLPNRGPMDHATGTNFAPDQSTTRAVRARMENMEYYLRGEVPPPRES